MRTALNIDDGTPATVMKETAARTRTEKVPIPIQLARISRRRGEGRGFTGCGKTLFGLSFQGAAGDEESRIALKTLRARFLAALGMTAWRSFSAACFSPAVTSPADCRRPSPPAQSRNCGTVREAR
jgi:hypothetical protein